MNTLATKDIFVGRIVKAFGIRGELKFHPSDDFWEEVLDSKMLMTQGPSDKDETRRPFRFQKSRPHGRSYVVCVDGVEDRNAAEALVGSEIFLPETGLDVEMPEELRPFQLVGCIVKTENGEVLGELSSVVYSTAHDVYEVIGDRGAFLVPAVDEFVKSIDLDNREVVIRPIPGLLPE